MLQTSVAAATASHEQVKLLSKNGHTPHQVNVEEKPEKRSCFSKKCHSCIETTTEVYHEIKQGCKQIDLKGQIHKSFTLEALKTRLPILKWIPSYRCRHFQGDLIAGITVGLTVVPQSLAYAKIAELPPQYGLYTAFMCCFVYVLLGTSRDINLGPAAVMSLLTAEFAHSIPALATLLALMCGIIQLAMGVFHLGFVVDYISHPVINSFTTAAAITIACSQIKKWLGLHNVPREFVQQFYWTIRKIRETQIYDFVLGLVCMILLYCMKKLRDIKWKNESPSVANRIGKKIVWIVSTARNAIVVIVSAGLAATLLHFDIEPFSLTGNITSGIPPFHPPEFTIEVNDNVTMSTKECFKYMGIGIVIVPLVGVIEAVAIGKAFGRKNGYTIDGNQEIIANGVANILSSFVSAYPVTASFSRSAVMSQSGVRTTAANLVSAILVLLSLAFLTPLFYFIPDSALAAVIIMAVLDMIDFSMLKHLLIINKVDLLPWFATFFISLLAGFEYGILLGVATSLLLLLYPWARPKVKAEQLRSPESDEEEEKIHDGVAFVSIPLGLMFPGVDYLIEKVESISIDGRPPRAVILDCSHVFKMDYTAVMGVKQMYVILRERETPLILINLRPSVLEQLQKAKIKHLSYAADAKEALKQLAAVDLLDDDLVKVVPANGNDSIVIHQSLSMLNNAIPKESDAPITSKMDS